MTQTAPAQALGGQRRSARERLLASAAELFYAEGVHVVGIDRIIEHAGVAKASLYKSFGSKDELVRGYLEQRHEITAARVMSTLERWDDPREKLLGVFVAQGERMAEPEYHGCPFVSATAECAPDSPALEATAGYRDWLRALFTDLAGRAGVADVAGLVPQLVMLYDGAALAMRLDGNRAAAATALAAATVLVEAAVPR